jgi:hypothetical protein
MYDKAETLLDHASRNIPDTQVEKGRYKAEFDGFVSVVGSR